MGITKQQWHVSQHQYDINHDVLQMVPEEYRAKLKCYNMKVNEDVKEIYEAFIDYLGGKGNITCYYDSRETMIRTERASQFKSFMNSLSDRIRGYLDAFIQPKKSYPYFISEMALNYAYRLPHTGKIVCAVYHGQEGRKEWKLELYQYTRYNKNNNQVELKLKDSYIADYYFRENTEQLVTFFSNARHFSVFDKYNRVSLPFNSECTTYYIHCDDFEYSIYTEHDVLLRRLPSDTKLKSRVVINEMSSVFGAVLQQDANEHYISPATMINKRRRECGLL